MYVCIFCTLYIYIYIYIVAHSGKYCKCARKYLNVVTKTISNNYPCDSSGKTESRRGNFTD